jgi:hypothetical protein
MNFSNRSPFLPRLILGVFCLAAPAWVRAGEEPPKVYVILWFDTEDYILPASDDAAKRVAEFLTKEHIRGTFKVVGEKARTLERRGRQDVIAALKQHEIGYHSNFHSVHPTPAEYLSNLGWDEGVAEFDRRERPGFDDVRRIFRATPTCYGQPGSSWAPQSYGAIRKWGMRIYLDAGSHVNLLDRPCYYCGVLNLYKLAYLLRADLKAPDKLEEAEKQFLAARQALLAEGGGIVSTIYHPCEFVHKEFWDGVNFRAGANPPRDRWQLPAAKTAEDTQAAFAVFENYVRFMKRFRDVEFITATDALKLYEDRARLREFTAGELRAIAKEARAAGWQQHAGYTLAASEVFWLLTEFAARKLAEADVDSAGLPPNDLYGPTQWAKPVETEVVTDASQFKRTVADVVDFMRKESRIPSSVWLGSVPVPPEMFLRGLSDAVQTLLDGKPLPDRIVLKPARFLPAAHIADDRPELWRWVIFPPGFHAPSLMDLAKRQAWTLKPALLATKQ